MTFSLALNLLMMGPPLRVYDENFHENDHDHDHYHYHDHGHDHDYDHESVIYAHACFLWPLLIAL